ncbi:hypothetical protein [Limimaricola cinnabarinus]|uniref:hypothetical protein n=1 Tax=Limimaricola cinnabarinus TaxID=1125964 RepID=UPI0005ED32B9|nr:hypothetical protein [Limimaricola cinnabarinus]
MYVIRLIAPQEQPREAALYDLEMSWVPMVGDTLEISCTGQDDLRYRVTGRAIQAAFRADHTQAGAPIVSLEVERISSIASDGAAKRSGYQMEDVAGVAP